jgi:formylglycine-generating enzyme required for sulfatase activity
MKNSIILLIFFPLRSALPAQTTLPPELVFVEGGTFTMGCTQEQQPNCYNDESPTRIVRLPAFEMGKYEVTQAQWQAVMGSNPGTIYGTSPDRPVYRVSYYDCATFCNRLSQQEGLERVYYFDRDYTQPFDSLVDGSIYVNIYARPYAKGYRLPTEAEWEYAARGGSLAATQTKYSGSNNLDEVGWHLGNNSPSGCKPVGQKLPNALGLYDMSGNEDEWCFDEYAYYGSSATCSQLLARCLRGGNWVENVVNCRVSRHGSYYPGSRLNGIGLRLSRTL